MNVRDSPLQTWVSGWVDFLHVASPRTLLLIVIRTGSKRHSAVRGGASDLAGLALADLASLHLRLGYPGDCRRLVELAEADPAGLSGPVRAVLAMVRAWVGEYEKRHHHINHDRRRDQR